MFSGADSALINDPRYTKDSAIVKDFFWNENTDKRRQKLTPFLWEVIAKEGQLLRNRLYDNNVAHLADKIIAGIWHLVQASSFYRDNTSFIITPDHGRGASPNTWYTHGFFINGSSQTWVALLGNGIKKWGNAGNEYSCTKSR